jgi:hypothetical protein
MSLGQENGVGLGAARTIADHALAHASGSDFPPMTVAVLDAAGQLVAFGAKTDPACCVGISRLPRHAAPSTWASAAEAGQPERRPTPRSSTQWSSSPMATMCPPPAGCSCATTTTTSSTRSGSAGPCPTTTKPAQSTASPPRGCALTPERLIQPDPAIPTNRLGDIS